MYIGYINYNRAVGMKSEIRIMFSLLFWITVLPLIGCSGMPTTSLYWGTNNGQFFTSDLNRAQQEIPFKIVVPEYFSGENKVELYPAITGPLRETQVEDKAEIEIRYTLEPGEDDSALVRMFEANSEISLGDTESNPHLEVIQVLNMQVLMREQGDFGLGQGIYFSFHSEELFFIVELYNMPYDEAIKLVESIIVQLE